MRMTAILGFALLFAGSLSGVPGAQEKPAKLEPPPGIEGWYEAAGRDSEGNPTHGIAVIAKTRQSYRVHWLYEDSGRADGVGHLDSGVLVVGYGNPVPVIVRYVVDAVDGKPRLRGKWVSWSGSGEETLTWLKGLTKKE